MPKRWGHKITLYEVLYHPEGVGVDKPWQYPHDEDELDEPPVWNSAAEAKKYRKELIAQGHPDQELLQVWKVTKEIVT